MLMQVFFICCIILLLMLIAKVTRIKGFEKLKITRNIQNNRIFEGEELIIETVVENNKWLPVSFILIKERIPLNFVYGNNAQILRNSNNQYHTSKYSILNYERRKRKYNVLVNKRGTYIIRDIQITIGDLFGFSAETKDILDYKEVIVYPKVKNISKFKFNNTNLLGDEIVKRWIHKDPLYVRGVREYNVEDRMKDIHWKSSLKMNKLMVKEYDYTSERELIIILNIQCGEIEWSTICEKCIEDAIKVGVALAAKATKEGMPTGMWTNAKLIGMQSMYSSTVKASTNSFVKILELCARIDCSVEIKFDKYLENKKNDFMQKNTYLILTPYLNEASVSIISKLRDKGMDIKLIDVSLDNSVTNIRGVEKVDYKGEWS
ncbi:hypothetical protein CLTEP_06070 [Clostridium tepidiprofundi DSM 19306]|uniref:DUF58 domain-containing protein n=1 Tax=Clostridium tepidiprofundi DSM 19306 TaxID=1121338 RepID=A0A151B667_9CLOT|nr:DUF58 domain-containing protein [Clostridium tepidiprofundi]KYH35431.1 hypothetical protein CLTEP_06070 [Clostridium tepidiprofundi DSM 19306]